MDYAKKALELRKRIALLGVTHGKSQAAIAERMGLQSPQLTYALHGHRVQPERLLDIEKMLDEMEAEDPAKKTEAA